MYNVSSWKVISAGNSNFTGWATWNNKNDELETKVWKV